MSGRVRAAALANYVEVARAVGLDPWAMLGEAGLPARCVSEPELKIPISAACELLERSAALSGVEAFGLLMAEGRRITNLGVLGMLAREEPTLRHALQAISRYGRMHNEALVQRLVESDGIAILHEELLVGGGAPVRQATELLLAIGVRVMQAFLGADWRARRLCLLHSAPADLTVHRRVLGQVPEFAQEFNGIVCTSQDLDTPIATADPVIAGYLRAQIQAQADAALFDGRRGAAGRGGAAAGRPLHRGAGGAADGRGPPHAAPAAGARAHHVLGHRAGAAGGTGAPPGARLAAQPARGGVVARLRRRELLLALASRHLRLHGRVTAGVSRRAAPRRIPPSAGRRVVQ